MASRNALLLAAASMAVIMGALLPAIARPDNHIVGEQKPVSRDGVHVVGESDGWQLGVDYNNWAWVNDGIPIFDQLEFVYDPALYNVVQVNEDGYNRCIVPYNGVTWNSGNDFLELDGVGRYFFICSMGDHCTQGMKLTITAV